ncbi:hypothetical protein [Paludisphaera rhizosphaerae]|uniref:hypothetical protein n=1 Tax=Paludisphaera rhizosphaerae TaxID=2711216 RepID=UPI0013EA841E|nr:hypothetical protein [Paludisphaera rhizosphaerae]
MSTDSGQRLPDPPRAETAMPNVIDVKTRTIKYEPRKPRNFKSAIAASNDAVEFVVKTDAPIPIRALGPALYVGGTCLTEVSEVGPNTYRFVAPARDALKKDAAIQLGWTGQPPASKAAAKFRYRP